LLSDVKRLLVRTPCSFKNPENPPPPLPVNDKSPVIVTPVDVAVALAVLPSVIDDVSIAAHALSPLRKVEELLVPDDPSRATFIVPVVILAAFARFVAVVAVAALPVVS